MEVLLCHLNRPSPWYYEKGIERFYRQEHENERCHIVMCFEHRLFYVVPTDYPIEKLRDALRHRSTPSLDGGNDMKKTVSMPYRIYQDLEDHRLFPPQDQHTIVALATRPPQETNQPITHWSLFELQHAVLESGIVPAISPSTIWRLLDQAAIKPHLWHYWLNSPDPDFETKMLHIVDLYLKASTLYQKGQVILSVDEKTSIQALERKYPSKPHRPGRPELIEHEYIRHGTRCLTAGFEVATGSVMGLLTDNHPSEIFAEFIAWACQYYSDVSKLHIVLDNLNTHYHADVCKVVSDVCRVKPKSLDRVVDRRAFLCDAKKRVVFHFTPSHASWLNQIEIWFSTLSRKVIKRGSFTSVMDLDTKIIEFIKYYNKRLARPYKWTYTGKPLAEAA